MYSTVFAQIKNRALNVDLQAQDGVTFISNFIPKLLFFGITIGTLFFFFMLLIGAIKWITSGGDKGQVESARMQIVHAVTGVVILVSIFAITRFIEEILNVNLIEINLSTFFQ